MKFPVADETNPEEVLLLVRARLRAELDVMNLHARTQLTPLTRLPYVLEPKPT